MTEICYGHVLARASSDFADPETPVNLTFGHVRSAAWFPKQSGEREVYRDDRSLPGSDSKKYRRICTDMYWLGITHIVKSIWNSAFSESGLRIDGVHLCRHRLCSAVVRVLSLESSELASPGSAQWEYVDSRSYQPALQRSH
jgi:hypothetical protein